MQVSNQSTTTLNDLLLLFPKNIFFVFASVSVFAFVFAILFAFVFVFVHVFSCTQCTTTLDNSTITAFALRNFLTGSTVIYADSDAADYGVVDADNGGAE